MNFSEKQLLLYAVTDRLRAGKTSFFDQIESALCAGVTMLQLREKELSYDEFKAEAIFAKRLCRNHGVPLIINDNVDLALEIGADGVHVGVSDMSVCEIRRRAGKDFIIGATAKTLDMAVRAEKMGANYLGVGALFPSETKKNAVMITREELSLITQSVSIPCVAIGGITNDNIDTLKGCGVYGVAIVSAIFSKKDIDTAVTELLEKAKEIRSC